MEKEIEKKIKVDEALFNSWKIKKQQGDIEDIVEESNLHRNTVADALKFGYMTETTFKHIKKFYANKKLKTLK